METDVHIQPCNEMKLNRSLNKRLIHFRELFTKQEKKIIYLEEKNGIIDGKLNWYENEFTKFVNTRKVLTESQKNVARLETKNNDLLIERDWLSNRYSKIFKELENCKSSKIQEQSSLKNFLDKENSKKRYDELDKKLQESYDSNAKAKEYIRLLENEYRRVVDKTVEPESGEEVEKESEKELENKPIFLVDKLKPATPVTLTGVIWLDVLGDKKKYIDKDIVNKQMTEMMREVANKITENIDKTVEEGKRLINELS